MPNHPHRSKRAAAPSTFAEQLIAAALAHQPTRDDRLTLARIALKTAATALRADPPDVGAARMFVDEAMLHMENAR